MTTDQITPGATRVRHDDYGVGTVEQIDGLWALVLFDGDLCATSVHADDLTPATD